MFVNKKYFPFILFLSGFLSIELFINPIGEFSLNDDWAYARSVFEWNKTGIFQIGEWPAMTLFSHSLLGFVFVKLFGFSFTVLRMSNMFLCVLTLFFIYNHLLKNNKPVLSGFVCAVIVLNPLYLNLFNSYMTDLTFINFSFLSFYALSHYLNNGRQLAHLFAFFILALFAIFTRQIGIILLLAFAGISIKDWIQNKTKAMTLFSALFIGISLGLLFFFEKYQSHQMKVAWSYKGVFFNASKIQLDVDSMRRFFKRAVFMLLYFGSVFSILGCLYVKEAVQKMMKNKAKFGVSFFAAVTSFLLISNEFPVGNIFYNCGLGPESTVDEMHLLINSAHSKWNILYMMITITMLFGYCFAIQFLSWGSIKKIWGQNKHVPFFLILLLILYSGLVGLSEVFFDRYSLFFILFSSILFFLLPFSNRKENYKIPIALLILLGSFSVLATKDYFNANRLKLSIKNQFDKELKTGTNELNAGFENQIWNVATDELSWANWVNYSDKKLMIARGPIPNYATYRTYTYQRYIPFKTDTFFLLIRK